MVVANAVRKSFGEREAVGGISFAIRPGICFGMLGPNGAGKTTLMRMLLGMTTLSGGSYTIFGEPAGGNEVRARIGVVAQQDNLDPDFTVRENLLIYARYFGIERTIAEQRADELLAFAELSARAGDKVSHLSGGMKRRLMIARALINDPELVVLDEPTTGLDPQARHLIWERLRQLRKAGKTLILTTHYMDEAEQLCDEIVVIDHGRILAQGAPQVLIREHLEPEVFVLVDAHEGQIAKLASADGVRFERIGDVWYGHAKAAAPLLARLVENPELRFTHRPANLEDLFLRLTGREMRE